MLQGPGIGPHGPGPSLVACGTGLEPRPFDLARTEARVRGHGARPSLRHVF